MKADLKLLIKEEQHRPDFGFISEMVQRGRHRPRKYQHSITMPIFLYEELRNKKIIDVENYIINECAFFEFNDTEAIISFISLCNCEDLHIRSLNYLVKKLAGSNPIKRSGIFF